ncbi:MAG: diguanylate cyclase [Gemmatimonadota bacterium]
MAHVLVPVRSVIVTAGIAVAAARGELDVLMVLPLTVIGPFFFLGLGFRAALVTVSLTGVTFVAAVLAVDLQVPVALRSGVFLFITAAACAIVARRLERWSRASFLEARRIVQLAELDPLTGVKNRRIFDDHLERLWQRATSDGGAIAILLIDVDHFKAYNDRYGHQAGDQTLRRVAQVLQPFARRPTDVFARYGGEEFAVVLNDMDADEARSTAERMRRAVSELHIEHRSSRVAQTVTISIGIALIEPDVDRRPRGALQLADQALYEAKVRGRNRVELMDDVQYRMLVTGVFARQPIG